MANTVPTPLRIVSIGGGTGLSTLLRGLKRYTRAAEDALAGRLPPRAALEGATRRVRARLNELAEELP